MIQLVTTEEPPWAMNGSVIPVSGISASTPPATTNTCSPTMAARPIASSRPNGSRSAMPVLKPREISSAYSRKTAVRPASPSSSPMVARMKSDLAAKPIRIDRPTPSPVPSSPPQAKANSDWAIWLGPWPAAIEPSGSSQSVTRPCTCGDSQPTPAAPTAARNRPIAIQPLRAVATYSITTNRPKKSSEVPRSVSSTRTATKAAQISSTGPITRPRGSWNHSTLRPVRASASRCTAR